MQEPAPGVHGEFEEARGPGWQLPWLLQNESDAQPDSTLLLHGVAPEIAIAAVGAVIERITGSPTAKPAAVSDNRRNTTRRLIPDA
jgi:hypothetical protein